MITTYMFKDRHKVDDDDDDDGDDDDDYDSHLTLCLSPQ